MEAAWRIKELPLNDIRPNVYRLAVHTKNQQSIVFEEGKEENASNYKNHNTTLTAWFELNERNVNAGKYLCKLLLNRVKGSTSFEDLRICNGITYQTFKKTAI